MAFAQHVEALCKQLDKRPAATKPSLDGDKLVHLSKGALEEVASKHPSRKRFRILAAGETHPLEFDIPRIPQMVNPREHLEALSDARRGAAHVLRGLSPTERRKLAALARAGRSGSSVKDHFKALSEGDFSSALASSSQIRKGLELAKAQKINLDAPKW